jgi:hypothetical protein
MNIQLLIIYNKCNFLSSFASLRALSFQCVCFNVNSQSVLKQSNVLFHSLWLCSGRKNSSKICFIFLSRNCVDFKNANKMCCVLMGWTGDIRLLIPAHTWERESCVRLINWIAQFSESECRKRAEFFDFDLSWQPCYRKLNWMRERERGSELTYW